MHDAFVPVEIWMPTKMRNCLSTVSSTASDG